VPKRLALYYADLKPKDLHQVEGVPVTTAARAIRDAHASHLGPALIRQAINDGRRTGHLTLDEAEQLEHELLGTNFRRRTRRTKSIRGDAAWRRREKPSTGPPLSAGVLAKYAQAYAREAGVSEGRRDVRDPAAARAPR
jgi:hypothetical protein